MPTRRRRIDRVDVGAVDVLAVEQDLPSMRAPRMSSCMRFRQRRKVDLPQPDGPMMRGDRLVAPVSSEMSSSARGRAERRVQVQPHLRVVGALASERLAWRTLASAACGSCARRTPRA